MLSAANVQAMFTMMLKKKGEYSTKYVSRSAVRRTPFCDIEIVFFLVFAYCLVRSICAALEFPYNSECMYNLKRLDIQTAESHNAATPLMVANIIC